MAGVTRPRFRQNRKNCFSPDVYVRLVEGARERHKYVETLLVKYESDIPGWGSQ